MKDGKGALSREFGWDGRGGAAWHLECTLAAAASPSSANTCENAAKSSPAAKPEPWKRSKAATTSRTGRPTNGSAPLRSWRPTVRLATPVPKETACSIADVSVVSVDDVQLEREQRVGRRTAEVADQFSLVTSRAPAATTHEPAARSGDRSGAYVQWGRVGVRVATLRHLAATGRTAHRPSPSAVA